MTQKKRKFPPTPERSYDDGEDRKRVWAHLARPSKDDSCSGSNGGYRHLRFDLVSVVDTYDPDQRQIRNDLRDETNDLVLTSQADQYRPDEMYGYELCYERPYRIGLHRLTRMQQFLAAVERKMERMKQEHGAAPDFASYVTRICRILDVHVLIEKREPGSPWSSYDDGKYRYTSLRTDGRFNGQECMWKVQRMVRDLWTDADRTAATEYQDRKERERLEQKQAREAEEAINSTEETA